MDRKQTHEMVIQIFEGDYDCEISYYYMPEDNGGNEYPSSDEDFEIVELRLIEITTYPDRMYTKKALCDIWKGLPEGLQKTISVKLIESVKENGF